MTPIFHRRANPRFKAYQWTVCLVAICGFFDYAMGQTQLPEGTGKEIVQRVCSQCHSLDYLNEARGTYDEWHGIVADMLGRGAVVIAQEEIPVVVGYLANNFQRGNPTPRENPTDTTRQDKGSPDGGQFVPVTDAVLQNPDPADWLTWRRDQNTTGYSPLDQVNRKTIQKMRLAWTWPMESGTQEQEPLVYKGVMYLPHTHGVVQALNARTGELIWEYRRKLPERLGNGTTRNIAIYQDKIFFTTEDMYLVALDARTGKLVWETKVADYTNSIRFTAGPIAADGKVFAAESCQTRNPPHCALTAHDAATGKFLWRRETIAGPADPEEHNATWGGVPYEKRMKGSMWLTGSYDPGLKLLYWTTASASPYPEILKGTGTGSLLYTNSILALDPNTGKIKWFFQMVPRDNHDEDMQDNPILADVQIDNTMRKAVYVLGKPGILWAFDRQTGSYLWHTQLVTYQNIYEKIDSKTGKITMNEKIISKAVGESVTVCPGMRGGKLIQTKAYNPMSKTIYSPVSNECTVNVVVPLDADPVGLDYDKIVHMPDSGDNVGRLTAVSALTGKLLWKSDQRAAIGSVLATAGGLVFAGDFYRYFRAYDAATGKVLWEVPLSGPVTGYPISYSVEGRQYVAVAVGGNTTGQRHLAQLYPELKVTVGNNALMVFTTEE